MRYAVLIGWLLLVHTVIAAQDRAAAVRNDLTNVVAAGGWIYNDLPKAFSEATKTRKPMLVVFRCVP
jgi:hypothetical protein